MSFTVLAAALSLLPLTADGQQDPRARLQRGLQLLENGRVEEAVEELEALSSQVRDSSVVFYHLGRALRAAGRPADAVVALRTAIELEPGAGPIQFELGQALVEIGDLSEAQAALDAAAATRPGYPPIEFYRAELCYQAGKPDAARQRLLKVAEAAPQWTAPLIRAGDIALEGGAPGSAAANFRAAIAISPGDADLWTRLGNALWNANEQREAVEAYRQAIEIDPDFLAARVLLATFLFDPLRDYDEAETMLREVLKIAPRHGAARLDLAQLLMLRGKHDEALGQVDLVLADLEGYAAQADSNELGHDESYWASWWELRAHESRAEILMKLGRLDEAEGTARQLLEDDPRNQRAHFVLGTALGRRRDPAANDHLKTFKALKDAEDHRRAAEGYRQIEELELARNEYRKALEADPADVESLLALSTLQMVSGEPQQAVDTLARARDAGAEGEDWYREWVLALHAVGRVDEARLAWQEAKGRGLGLGPRVWALLREAPGVCR